MDSYSVHYRFSQPFDFPVKDAFEWSVDYDEKDIVLSGRRGTRKIETVNDDTLVLTDTVTKGKKRSTKKRLIRIYPELFTLVNTRISAANRHSQFIYRFLPDGENRSRLDFIGAHVFYGKRPPSSRIAALARELAEEDATIWKNLAVEMKRDLSGK